MPLQDPKPGRNRRKYKRSHYAKDLLKSRASEKHSEPRATRQAGRLSKRQREEHLDTLPRMEPIRPRWGTLERQSFRMAPLLGWLRKKVGLPWSAVLTQIIGRLDLNSPTGYTAYRELTVSVVWDENVDGPVSSWHLSNSGFYVESTSNLLRYRRA